MIFALGMAIITQAFPPGERGKALGISGALVSIGIVVGPHLLGILIAMASIIGKCLLDSGAAQRIAERLNQEHGAKLGSEYYLEVVDWNTHLADLQTLPEKAILEELTVGEVADVELLLSMQETVEELKEAVTAAGGTDTPIGLPSKRALKLMRSLPSTRSLTARAATLSTSLSSLT